MRLDVTSRNYNAGEHIVDIPNASRKFLSCVIRFTRENWPAGVVSVFIERALDGVKWEQLASATFEGGDPINTDTGLPYAESSLGVFSIERDGDLRVRAVSEARIKTAITVDTL